MTPTKLRARKSRRAAPRLSMAVENYLLSIYELQEEGHKVTTTRLAEHLKRLPEGEGLGTSLPSVAGMLRRMVRDGLLKTTDSKDVVLAATGRVEAEGMVRRHRLAKRMVVDLLGLEPHKAYVEAHRLEHAISPDLEAKIDEGLGYPTTCPFGHPIPGSAYIAAEDAVPLSQAPPRRTFIVDRIPDDDQPLLKYFVDNRLIPGQPVEVVEAALYRGVVTLVCDDTELVVGYEVAERIWVRGGGC